MKTLMPEKKLRKVIDGDIIKNSLTEQASDHYPTYAVLV